MKEIDKKDLITEAAMSCFLANGYGGTSMDEIVKISGVSKGGIYWYFKSKEEIFLYFLNRELEKQQQQYEQIARQTASAQEQLHQFFLLHYQKTQKEISSLHLVIGEFLTQLKNAKAMEKVRQLIAKKHNAQYFIQQVLELGIKNQEFSPHDSLCMTEFICSICEGSSFRYLVEHRDQNLLQKTLRQAEEIILQAISIK